MLPGETQLSGAPSVCSDCNSAVPLTVCHSGGGWYIGSTCDCGPYSRESDYYPTAKAAEAELLVFLAFQRGIGPMPEMARC
jgi:hypothetical protein